MKSWCVNRGEVIGEAKCSLLGSRGLLTRRGDEGGGFLAGDWVRRGEMERAGRTRLLLLGFRVLVARLRFASEAGDSVRQGPERIEEGMLLSLSFPLSLSTSIDPRLDD